MQLKLQELQKVVNKIVSREKKSQVLKREISRVLGPTVITTRGLRDLAESANSRLDEIEAFKLTIAENVDSSILLQFIDSDDSTVRKMVARLLPEACVKVMASDDDEEVRTEVAKRASKKLVAEMINRNPKDYHLKYIYKKRFLSEAGLPTPKKSEKEFDINGHMVLGDLNDMSDQFDHTDEWYDSLARKIISMYGGNIEGQWEEIAVKNYCKAEAAQGNEIDEQKLLDAIYSMLVDRDDNALEEGSLKNLARELRRDDMEIMPVISESKNELQILIENVNNAPKFVEKFEEMFSVKKDTIKETFSRMLVPASAVLPTGKLGVKEERVFDAYVRHWNTQRNIRNQPYRLSWHPSSGNKVKFSLERK